MGNADYLRVTVGGGVHMWNGDTVFRPSELEKPYKWKAPRTIFVSSMGDLFHESVPFEWLQGIMRTVMELPRHQFIFLTKRPDRMKLFLSNYPIPLYNLALGVSAEGQSAADERIRILLQIPAAKRFVSIEPMLGLVDLYRGGWSFLSPLRPPPGNKTGWKRGLDGVILGGESRQ
jgi:protein gp37